MLAVAELLRVLARRGRSGAMGRNRAGAEGAGGGAERVGQGCGRACLREREQVVKEVRLALHLRTATRRCGHVSPRPQRGDNQRTHRSGFDPAARTWITLRICASSSAFRSKMAKVPSYFARRMPVGRLVTTSRKPPGTSVLSTKSSMSCSRPEASSTPSMTMTRLRSAIACFSMSSRRASFWENSASMYSRSRSSLPAGLPCCSALRTCGDAGEI